MTWKKAQKIAGMFAKQLVAVVPEIALYKHLQLITLEGPRRLQDKEDKPDMLCTGINRTDPWLQSSKNVIANYDLEAVTPDGWLYFTPKPTRIIECRSTDDELQQEFDVPNSTTGQIFRAKRGDFICRNIDNNRNQWVVDKNIFLSTYKIIEQ